MAAKYLYRDRSQFKRGYNRLSKKYGLGVFYIKVPIQSDLICMDGLPKWLLISSIENQLPKSISDSIYRLAYEARVKNQFGYILNLDSDCIQLVEIPFNDNHDCQVVLEVRFNYERF